MDDDVADPDGTARAFPDPWSHPALDNLSPAEAEMLRLRAAQTRAQMIELRNPDPLWLAERLAEADALDTVADRLRDPAVRKRPTRDLRPALGGETVPAPSPDAPGRWRDTMHEARQSPDLLAVDAGLDRLGLARDAGVLTAALDVAQSIGAADARQKMRAHQLAAGHRLAMRLLSSADDDLERHNKGRAMNLNPGAQAEATRSASAGARLMEACARVPLALDRLGSGGTRQTIVVQHFTAQSVTVADGGQAVVAGAVAAATQATGEGRR